MLVGFTACNETKLRETPKSLPPTKDCLRKHSLAESDTRVR